jgi:LacI family transcriptional regulator
MPTKLKQIAELAGVSTSTVSRVMNQSPLISEKTRRAVMNAAHQLNYQPEQMSMIGVIVPKITNPLYGEVVAAIEARASQAGYGILLCDTNFDLEREQEQITFLSAQSGVRGMVVVPVDPTAAHIRSLVESSTPCVILGSSPILGADQVNVDAAMGAYLITRHLLEIGHRRIGLVLGPSKILVCQERMQGYCQALEEYAIPFDPALVAEGDVDETGGAAAMSQLLHLAVRDMTAVATISDVMVLGVFRKIREAGLQIPGDLSVAGCDDIPVSALLQPAVTTVWQPKGELGLLSAKFILRQIETMKTRGSEWKSLYPFQNAMYQPYLIVRESTRKLS